MKPQKRTMIVSLCKYSVLCTTEALQIKGTACGVFNGITYTCTLITFTSKAPPRDLYPMYPMVHQGKLVVLRGTPSKPVVTVVQQLVLKNGYHMVAVPSRSKKKEGVKL